MAEEPALSIPAKIQSASQSEGIPKETASATERPPDYVPLPTIG